MDRRKKHNFNHIEDVAMGRVDPDRRFCELMWDPEYEEYYFTIRGLHAISKQKGGGLHEICQN